MIPAAMNYLRESEDAATTVIIGGILTLFAFLIVPLFAVAGYLVRVLDRTASGEEEPPIFEDWGDLIVEGAKASIVAFVYASVPTVVLLAFVVSGGLLGSSDSGVLGAVGAIGVVLGLVAWIGLSLAAAYVVPVALANFAENRTLGAGFDRATLGRVLVDRTYAVGWLTALAVVVAGGLVAGLLSLLPIVGAIAGAFVSFYAAVMAYYVVGRTWGELRHVPAREQPAAPGRVEI